MSTAWTLTALSLSLAIVVGCNSGDSGASVNELEALAGQLDAEAEVKKAAAEKQAIQDAATDAQARADALAGTEATLSSDKNALGRKKAKSRGGYLGTIAKVYVEKPQEVQNDNVLYNMRIHAAANGHPKSHEEYMRVVRDYGLSLPPLEHPYEYWYNAEDRKLYTRVKPEVVAEAQAEADAARAEAKAAQNE